MNCPYCGAEQLEDTRFCTECGKYIGQTQESVSAAPAGDTVSAGIGSNGTNTQVFVTEAEPDRNGKWGTITTWGWIGILLLLQIPIVNFVLVIVWSFGVSKKQVKQSFARAVLILGLVTAIISVVGTILLVRYGSSLYTSILNAIF